MVVRWCLNEQYCFGSGVASVVIVQVRVLLKPFLIEMPQLQQATLILTNSVGAFVV